MLWCVLVGFLWVLVGSGRFWWVLVSSGAVPVCFGEVPVGSGEFWWVLVGSPLPRIPLRSPLVFLEIMCGVYL